MLEDRQSRHQPRRQRRAAGRIRIDGSELLLEEAPVDRHCELHHWMIKVDDLVEPRPEEIALSGLPTFIRPHESPRPRPQAARESRPARRINLQENLSTTAATRQIRLLRTARKLQPIRGLGVLHGRLITVSGSRKNPAHKEGLPPGSFLSPLAMEDTPFDTLAC